MSFCQHPDCNHTRLTPVEGTTEYCATRNAIIRKQERIDNAPAKPVTPLRKSSPPKRVSDKRAGQLAEYNKRVEVWKKGKTCVMCDWGGIKKPCEHAHHAEGREGERLLDFTKLVPLCAKHHIWATEHSKEAIELGISLPRNSKHETI